MNRKILVCDDDLDILEMVQMILEDEHTMVVTVSNSMKAIGEIEKQQPDLVLLDLWMPVLSGDQIVRQLRKKDGYSDIPVLIMSASRDGREVAEESGATDFISKPFDIDDLTAQINRCIKH